MRQEFHVYAEYCPGPFFWGWHSYVAPVLEGVAGGVSWPRQRLLGDRRYKWLQNLNACWSGQFDLLVLTVALIVVPQEATVRKLDSFSEWLGESLPMGFRVTAEHHGHGWNDWRALSLCDDETPICTDVRVRPRPWRKSDFVKIAGASGMDARPEVKAEFEHFATQFAALIEKDQP